MIKELSDVLTNDDVFKATQEVGFHNEEILKSPLTTPIKIMIAKRTAFCRCHLTDHCGSPFKSPCR